MKLLIILMSAMMLFLTACDSRTERENEDNRSVLGQASDNDNDNDNDTITHPLTSGLRLCACSHHQPVSEAERGLVLVILIVVATLKTLAGSTQHRPPR